jgi:hypothetical protein
MGFASTLGFFIVFVSTLGCFFEMTSTLDNGFLFGFVSTIMRNSIIGTTLNQLYLGTLTSKRKI